MHVVSAAAARRYQIHPRGRRSSGQIAGPCDETFTSRLPLLIQTLSIGCRIEPDTLGWPATFFSQERNDAVHAKERCAAKLECIRHATRHTLISAAPRGQSRELQSFRSCWSCHGLIMAYRPRKCCEGGHKAPRRTDMAGSSLGPPGVPSGPVPPPAHQDAPIGKAR
jgi:hypothetical protein